MSGGPLPVFPAAFVPWHCAQMASNACLPIRACCESALGSVTSTIAALCAGTVPLPAVGLSPLICVKNTAALATKAATTPTINVLFILFLSEFVLCQGRFTRPQPCLRPEGRRPSPPGRLGTATRFPAARPRPYRHRRYRHPA